MVKIDCFILYRRAFFLICPLFLRESLHSARALVSIKTAKKSANAAPQIVKLMKGQNICHYPDNEKYTVKGGHEFYNSMSYIFILKKNEL